MSGTSGFGSEMSICKLISENLEQYHLNSTFPLTSSHINCSSKVFVEKAVQASKAWAPELERRLKGCAPVICTADEITSNETIYHWVPSYFWEMAAVVNTTVSWCGSREVWPFSLQWVGIRRSRLNPQLVCAEPELISISERPLG